jgi:hypothetical protein
MARLSRKYLEGRFKRVHAAMGWPKGPVWKDGKAQVGAVFLQKGPCGWHVTQIVNEGGAEKHLTGWLAAFNASELDAWFTGVLFAKGEG